METGNTYTLKIVVSDADTAEKIGSGGLPVYATPAMISHMESASFLLAAEYGHQTVGTKVCINHMRACRPGTEVTITAELTEIDGRRLGFKVKAEDRSGTLGEGEHHRYIIDAERFMAKLD